MQFNLKLLHKSIFFLSFFTLISLWNIPHTIAGRYICEALLLTATLLYKPNWRIFVNAKNILLIFFIYLSIQLVFFSTDYSTAFDNFRAEWMHFILFSIIGAGVGITIGRNIPLSILFFLGIAFSIPIYIHLALSLIKFIQLGAIPQGYWGISETHGDLGYASLQASIFLFTYYLYQSKSNGRGFIVIFLLGCCLCSTLLAHSRGGTFFIIFSVFYIYCVHSFLGRGTKLKLKNKLIGIIVIILIMAAIYQAGVTSDPGRWQGIGSRISIGLEGNPKDIYCLGIETLENELKSQGIAITPQVQKDLLSASSGDGTRIIVARSGLSLLSKFPMGINQSRQAYQEAMVELCGREPVIAISHTHNAWIDTALSIGIPGAVLLILVLLNYARLGLDALKKDATSVSAFGMALFASACIWILRGFLDSTLRDQMLEMQAFVLALLLGVILAKKENINATNKR